MQKWIIPDSGPILPSINAMTFFLIVLGYAFVLAQFCPRTHASPQNLRTETTNVNGHLTTLTIQSFGSKGTLGIEFSQPAKTRGPAPVSPTVASKPNPIKSGLTTFGDSYAAGFGTGRTTFDSCAQGQFSYGKILASGAPKGTFHERQECTGAVIVDVAQGVDTDSQIDVWRFPQSADVVTLSIGGNDLGFSDIVDGCFVRFFRTKSPDCEKSISRARDILKNGTIQSFIEITLVQIINKSTRDDLKVFLTGYPAFFNVDTKFCNDVSFSYWPPIPRNVPSSPCDAKRKPCLSQEIRQTANDLSIEVNRMLAAAVQRVNAEKGPKVHFIDPNPAFNGHRFCEVDDGKEVVEPNPDRADTWFFLSEWHDNKLDGGIAAAAEDIDPTLGNENANTTAIPPSSSVCGDISNPKNFVLCAVAQINEDPTSPEYQRLVEDQKEIQSGNFSAHHIPWFIPTRLAKTFHARTLGEKAYADLIIQAS